MNSMFSIPIRALLEFCDDPGKSAFKQFSAISSVIGEDLGSSLLINYFERQGNPAKIVGDKVTQGTNKGSRLDRWLQVEFPSGLVLYQVEIKNSGAHAIGGRRLPITADKLAVQSHKIERWSKEWNGETFIKPGVKKVLIPMRVPKGLSGHLMPLICFWDAMHPTGEVNPFFEVEVNAPPFTHVHVFSMSSFLRNCLSSGDEFISIEALGIARKMSLLEILLGRNLE